MTFKDAHQRVHRHRRSGVALDTNLLLPWWVGSFDRGLLSRFKRTRKYSESFDLLLALTKPISRLFITPHVLTELSNLAGQLDTTVCESFREQIARIIQSCDERTAPSASLVVQSSFPRLGLTDVALAELAGRNVLLLTDDLPLYLELISQKRPVIYFTYVLRDKWQLT